MFRIGDFSRIARVSGRLLRYYDEIGLLSPEFTDPQTGYRYYSAQQLPQLNRILVLKELGLSLEQIARLLAQDMEVAELRGMLALRKAQIEQALQEEMERLRVVEARIQQIDVHGAVLEPDVVLKSMPAQPFLALRDVFPGMDALRHFMRTLVTSVPQRVERGSLGHIAIMTHGTIYEPDALEVEIGYLLTGRSVPSLTLSEERELTLRELPAVETMATFAFTGRINDMHIGHSRLGSWIEQQSWQIAGAGREVLLQLPQPEPDGDALVEIQLPVTKNNEALRA